MSSGQWEVVGKSKKAPNGKVKSGKEDEKKPVKNGPKVEDILPASKSMYAGMAIDDDKKIREQKKKEAERKKRLAEKKLEASRPKPPKTIETALQLIDATELANLIATNQVRFTNAPLVWLKEVAGFLNTKVQIEVDDPTFANYPPNFPVVVMPNELKNQLKALVKNAGTANAQLFFDMSLAALANDMSRGQLVNGHRILIQLIALEHPEFCVSSIAKSASLRNSYQNRPPIGLSLLWAFGQGGVTDFAAGLQAWQELFLPIIELKNYTKYITSYLCKLLDRHFDMESGKVTQDKLLAMFDLVGNKRSGLGPEPASDLIKQLSKYKDMYFNKGSNKLQVTFNQLMKKLPNQYLSGTSLDPFSRVIVQSLVDCLVKDDSCNATWRQLFHRCSKQSATLLDYIDSNWSEVSTRLKQKSLKSSVLQYMEVSSEALKGKKKDETVVRANKVCQDILSRMTSSRRFPWVWASFFLLLSIIGLVAYDVSRVNGNFPKSATGRLFNDLGILEQSQQAWRKTLQTSARGYVWLEHNTPIYYASTVEYTKPYVELTRDAFIIGANKAGVLYSNIKEYVVEKTPVVAATVEQYAPGLIENVQGYTAKGWSAVRQYSVDSYLVTSDYFKTKVFVGDWAPAILQNRTESAYNATRTHVATYYTWFRQQVSLYSNLP